MGYQVGNACYATREQAENVYYSQVLPVITSDGKINQIEFNGKNWKYQNEILKAQLPECSIGQNFKDGAEIGFMLMLMMVGLWGIKLTIDYIKRVAF